MRLENRPPSAMFITCSGRKSGDERGAPMLATRTCVCGAPGLSTMTTRARVVAGAPSCGSRRRAALPRAERLLGQRPQLVHRDVAGDDERGVVRHEVLLPERHHVVARDRLDRRLGADLGVAVRMLRAVERRRHDLRRRPAPGCRAAARAARAGWRAGARFPPPGTTDSATTSAIRSSVAGKFFASDRADTVVESIELLVASDAPSCATSSAICSALRVVVPSSSIAAAKFASPACRRVRVAAGLEHQVGGDDRQPRRSLRISVRPFGSVAVSGVGSCSGCAAPGLGICVAPRLVGVDRLGALRPGRRRRRRSAPAAAAAGLPGTAWTTHARGRA